MAARRARIELRLYVAGTSPNSQTARANLDAHIRRSGEDVELEIIDVLASPERCSADGVLVTPTLVRVRPAPRQQVVGNLTRPEAIAALFGVKEPRERG